MSYVLVPGAGGWGWFWHLLVAELERRGHRAVAVDLPGADPAAGLAAYRDLIAGAVRETARDGADPVTLRPVTPVTLVALSLGGFSAPLACERIAREQLAREQPGGEQPGGQQPGGEHNPVARLVLVNAMIPAPGETAAAWWDNVGWQDAAQAAADADGRPKVDVNDTDALFYHDVPAEVTAAMRADPDAESWTESAAAFDDPWPLAGWPDVPTTVLAGRDDRFFPPGLQREVAARRLGVEAELVPGGHLLPLSQPEALADRLTGMASLR
jgi:pimeloyl-ACP methyl ester carboxylesterase